MNLLNGRSLRHAAHRAVPIAVVLALGCLASAAGAATITWRGTVDGAWDTSTANWAGGASTFTAGDTVTFDDTATGTTGITIATAVTPSGTVTVNNATKAYSFSGASGLVGNVSLLKLGTGSLAITGSNRYTGTNATVLRGGTTTISGNAIVTSTNATANTFNIATQAGDNATLVIKDNAAITSNGLQMANNATSAATVFMQGGSLTVLINNGAASNFTRIGTSGTGVFTQTGGLVTIDTGLPTLGRNAGSRGTLSVSSGTFRLTGNGTLQVGYDGVGVMNVSGNGVVDTGTGTGRLLVVATGTNTGTVNLDGGTLRTRQVATTGAAASTSTFNFNGGTLVATTSTTGFLQGLDAANVKSGGAIIDTNGNTITIAQNLLDGGGGGGLTKTGLGTLTLSGTNVYTGTTTISQGILAITSTTALPGYDTAGRFSVAAGAGLALPNSVDDTAIGQIVATGNFASGAQIGFDTSAGDRTYAAAIDGAIGLAKTSANTLTLSGNSNYAGATTIAGGTIRADSGNALGSGGDVTFAGGALQFTAASAGLDVGTRIKNSTTTMSLDTNGQDVTLTGIAASNTSGLTKNGLGALTLAGSPTYSGVTAINSGSLALTGSGSLTSNIMLADAAGSAATFTMTGGTISASSALGFFRIGGTGTGTWNQSGGLVTADGVLPTIGRFAGSVSEMNLSSGTFRLTGATNTDMQVGAAGQGTLTISGNGVMDTGTAAARLLIVAQNASGTGVVNLNGGTLRTRQIATTGTGAASSTFNFNGGKLVALASSTTFMQGLTAANVNAGGADIDTNGNAITIAQALLAGGGGLTKRGAGSLTLAGVNTYTGPTAVSAGSLIVNGSLVGSVAISAGASLGGSGSVGALAGAGLVGPGNSPGILTAPSVDPAGGLAFAFEFTQSSPNYAAPLASGNDVLWLTGTSPFASVLAPANVVNIYMTPTVLASGTATGGFFTSSAVDFLASVSGGSFQYFVQDASGSHSYGGQNYMTLAEYDSSKSVTISTVAENGGQAMQMVVVPEPAGIVIAAVGVSMAGWTVARRARRRR